MAVAEIASSTDPSPETIGFYVRSMELLRDGGVPFLVGGAYAFARYTGIERHTKDFDIFLCREHFPKAKKIFESAGYESELTFPHWIGKAIKGDDFVDLIFGAGNGIAVVDERWFEYAVEDEVLGVDVKLIPAEEMIWSKGTIMERERYDGADVAHVILATGDRLDWRRLIERFGKHWRALFAHLVLFGFIYPSKRSQVPAWVIAELSERVASEAEQPDAAEDACYGTILSRQQYLTDVGEWGFRDARLRPSGNMTREEIAQWTAGIDVDGTQ